MRVIRKRRTCGSPFTELPPPHPWFVVKHLLEDSMAAVFIQIAPLPTYTETALAALRSKYEVGIGLLAAHRTMPCGTRAEFEAKADALSNLTVECLEDAGRACARGPVHAAGFPALAAPRAGATIAEWRRYQTKMDRVALVAQRHPRASLQATGGAVSAAQDQEYDGALPLPCALLHSSFLRRPKVMAHAGIDRHSPHRTILIGRRPPRLRTPTVDDPYRANAWIPPVRRPQ